MLLSIMLPRIRAVIYLISILAFVASLSLAAPVSSIDLVSTNFVSTTSKGMWFVEFYSPKCPHCLAFMKTWDLLLEMHGHLSDSSNFHFARVDCLSQGDVCADQDVKGYPTMFLYSDGTKSEEFQGDRSFDVLSTFILSRAVAYKKVNSEGNTIIPN